MPTFLSAPRTESHAALQVLESSLFLPKHSYYMMLIVPKPCYPRLTNVLLCPNQGAPPRYVARSKIASRAIAYLPATAKAFCIPISRKVPVCKCDQFACTLTKQRRPSANYKTTTDLPRILPLYRIPLLACVRLKKIRRA